MRTPAAFAADKPSIITFVNNSPGATTATPGGYGAIKSADIRPMAFAAATISVSAKYASRIDTATAGTTDQLRDVAEARGGFLLCFQGRDKRIG